VILKEKEFQNLSDPRWKAGEEAEKQMAFYLQRAFRKRSDCFVINDLRIAHDGESAQIDHLIVSPYGLVIIESKSCHSTIIVDEFNRWARTFNDKPEGMQSPVLQAEEQKRVLKELLQSNTERLLGKMLMGSVQKGFGYCPFFVYVSISDTGIIEQRTEVPELHKADEVTKAITDKLDDLKKKSDLLSPRFWLTSEVGWRMKLEEAKAVAEFLVTQHQPKINISPLSVEVAKEVSARKIVSPRKKNIFVPKVGAKCPECRAAKLIRKSIKRSDGTETDFLACEGYPSSCKAIFPLVALVRQKEVSYEIALSKTKAFGEGMPCPRCSAGKQVRRKGKNGKSDFLGCSNYGKTKCGFTEPTSDFICNSQFT